MRLRERLATTELPIKCGELWYDSKMAYDNFLEQDMVYKEDKLYNPLGGPGYFETSSDRCMDTTNSGPPYKSGGPLDIRHFHTDELVLQSNVEKLNSSWFWQYRGGFLPAIMPSLYLDWCVPTDPSLDDYQWVNPNLTQDGATAWNRFKPSTSFADGLVFAGEIKDVPRTFKTLAKAFHDVWKAAGGHRTDFGPKSVADQWLNQQFGWLPFLNDLDKFSKLTRKLEKRLHQVRRDNGQWVKRGGVLRTESSEEIVHEQYTSPGVQPTFVTSFYNSPYGESKTVKTDEQTVWFEGRFRYHIPEFRDDGPATMWEMAKMYGLLPSPTAVWELTPWSWLIDWCTNFQEITENIWSIVSEGACSKYAYIMTHRKQTVTTTGMANFYSGPVEGTWTASAEQKVRLPADPLGFGLDPGGYTARQVSILAALGITRM